MFTNWVKQGYFITNNKFTNVWRKTVLCVRRMKYCAEKATESHGERVETSTHGCQCNDAHWKSVELYHRSNVPFSYQISFPIPTQNVFSACHKPISFLFFFVNAKHFKRKTNQQKAKQTNLDNRTIQFEVKSANVIWSWSDANTGC